MPPPTGPPPLHRRPLCHPKEDINPQGARKEKTFPWHHWKEDSPRKMKRETPEVESPHSGQDAHRTSRSTVCPGTGQVGQHCGSPPEAQYMRRHPHQGSKNYARV